MQGHEAYHYLNMSRIHHLTMSRIHPECSDSDPSDRSVAADLLFREEPDAEEYEEEEEDEDNGGGKEDDDDDGYSE